VSSRRKPPVFDLEQLLTYRISMLFNRLSVGTSRQLAGRFDLALREWRVLALLAKREPVSASTLVARSPLDKASVSRAVASLAERGLLVSKPSEEDRRSQTLALTREGRRLFRQIAPLSVERQQQLLADFSESERKALFRALDRLIERADELLAESTDR
jgi:DNA-binding MarR family transcriptional regulator